jgi:hypothetical protein
MSNVRAQHRRHFQGMIWSRVSACARIGFLCFTVDSGAIFLEKSKRGTLH